MPQLTRMLYNYMLLLIPPVVTTAYLAFCWTDICRDVILPTVDVVDTSVENITLVKSGVTTISIMVIALGLWPIKNLLVNIQGEEFFRVLKQSPIIGLNHNYHNLEKPQEMGGINLVTANSMSSVTSLGIMETIVAIFKKQCSPHFSIAFVCSFIVLAASTLAPASLSVQEFLVDSAVMAFEVGAMRTSSVVDAYKLHNPMEPIYAPSTGDSSYIMAYYLQEAASLAWAETAFNFSHSFTTPIPDPLGPTPQYIIPFPLNLTLTTPARWLTDAFVLRLSCNWYTTNLSTGTYTLEEAADEQWMVPVTIPELNIALRLDLNNTSDHNSYTLQHYSVDETGNIFSIFNSTTGDIATRGHSVWALTQRNSFFGIHFDQANIPTFEVSGEGVGSRQFAILVCSPNLSLETVKVRNQGGNVTIVPANIDGRRQPFTRQGNLDEIQGNFFFMALFGALGTNAGPILKRQGQSQGQASLVFGWDQVRSYNWSATMSEIVTWSPMPVSNITDVYTRFIRSASKPYLSGAFGTALVPGVVSEPFLKFVASRPHVIASTIFFAVLDVLSIVAFFRSGKGDVFNLIRVSSILHESNVTGKMERLVAEKRQMGGSLASLEEELEAETRNFVLKLDERGETGVLVIHKKDEV
ncbi:hypothetical protein AX16_002507 [Volvariella volvacea WC 439]|nr:hypothetical protein AX16_002507 [Volvariella volvacea WC 439]